EELRDNDYSLNPFLYFNRPENPEGYKILKIKDLLIPAKGKKERIWLFDSHGDSCVMLENMSRSALNIMNNGVRDVSSRMDYLTAYTYTSPVLIICSGFRTVGYYEPSMDSPLHVEEGHNSYRIRHRNINIGYLSSAILDLFAEYGNQKMRFMDITTFKNMVIGIPSTTEQEAIYQARLREAKLAKAKQLDLQEVIDEMKAEYINTIRTRKHDMRPYLRELGSVERLLRHYLDKQDEYPDYKEKMYALLDQHQQALTQLSDLVEILSEEEKFGTPKPFDLKQYFLNMAQVQHEENAGYQLDFVCNEQPLPDKEGRDATSMTVNMSPLDFERVVNNILMNAKTHGFTQKDRKDYKVTITLSKDVVRNMYQIDFANNGTPFPKGLDKKRYGLLGEKAGKTGGTGRGGYVVKAITEHYRGDYDVFTENGNSVVRILIPIYYGK
ncbi:MAG: hypothetical protein K6E54_03995, partial [Bacteroidaceae bacterium]|nr:hypothetical protein [Bacteroidaceae bacterium]